MQLLLTVLLLVACSTTSSALGDGMPRTLKQIASSSKISGINLLKYVSPIVLTTSFAKVARSEGKLEYQPALQGLDYGKVR
jgi:hypothetical protein